MKRIFGIAAALSVGAVLFGATTASAGSISGCTDNGDGTQTCNLYETDANGDPSEWSSPVGDVFGSDWNLGYWKILDPNGSLSDVVVFYNTSEDNNGFSNAAVLCSLDEGPVYGCSDIAQEDYILLGLPMKTPTVLRPLVRDTTATVVGQIPSMSTAMFLSL